MSRSCHLALTLAPTDKTRRSFRPDALQIAMGLRTYEHASPRAFARQLSCIRHCLNHACHGCCQRDRRYRLRWYLERFGTEVRVYSPTSDTPAFDPAVTLVSVSSVRIPGRGEYRLGMGLSAGLRSDVQAFRPDIVHVSAPDWTGVAAQRLARAIDVPVVATHLSEWPHPHTLHDNSTAAEPS